MGKIIDRPSTEELEAISLRQTNDIDIFAKRIQKLLRESPHNKIKKSLKYSKNSQKDNTL